MLNRFFKSSASATNVFISVAIHTQDEAQLNIVNREVNEPCKPADIGRSGDVLHRN